MSIYDDDIDNNMDNNGTDAHDNNDYRYDGNDNIDIDNDTDNAMVVMIFVSIVVYYIIF